MSKRMKVVSNMLLVMSLLLAALGIFPGGARAAAPAVELVVVNSFELPAYGLTYTRYQQVYGGAQVLGGQLTTYTDGSGALVAHIGRTYENILAANSVGISQAAARGIVSRDIGAAGERLVQLMIDPHSGRYFYAVETRRADSRWVHWIDAGSGATLNKFDAFAENCGSQAAPCGFGVAYDDGDSTDVKDLTGLTTWTGSTYQLYNGRQETHDTGSTRRPFLGPVATDADNSWVQLGDVSPAQPALVDAQYYAYVTDQYYLGTFGYNWVTEANKVGVARMVIHAHYSVGYNNAGWNGSYVVIGDGDQVQMRELTPLDVVGHELTHAVTDFTSDLIYQYESGALNEAFSDIMGSSMEFYAEAAGLEPAASLAPDWYIGEDLDLTNDTVPGFRNMADPTEDGDPSHYADRYTGTSDNGGVHINSGIANHWFYLLVNGGQNANPLRASGTNVVGIGLDAAQQIAFLGFTALPQDATFCDARQATIAVAGGTAANVADAWDEVGVDEALCGGGGTNTPPTADFTFSTSGLTVNFTDASTDTDGSVVAWSWNFGDGATSTQQNPSHNYAAAGTYAVTLMVTDNEGASNPVTKDVTVSSAGGETLHVYAIDMTGLRSGANRSARAVVSIRDTGGNPVSGATVTGTWSGAYTGNVSGVTGVDGTVTFTSGKVKTANASFTFTVADVTASGYTYNPALNVETEDTIVVP